MKILYIATSEYRAPTPQNVIQAALWIAGEVAEGITRKGYETVYFGAGDSTLKVSKNVNAMPPFFELYDYEELMRTDRMIKSKLQTTFQNNLNLELLKFLETEKVDLIHYHTSPPFFSLPYAAKIDIPKVFTFHDPLFSQYGPIFKLFHKDTNHFVSISNNQRKPMPDLPYAATVYNGVDSNHFKFDAEGGEGLIFVGRVTPAKGVKEAITVAKQTGKKLIVLGAEDLAYFDWLQKEIKPLVDGEQIQFPGHVDREHAPEKMGKSKALLFPIQWDEPFGLVMIEAMACGTPVIGFSRASVPEVIIDGVTGFIVNPSEEDKRGEFIIKKTGLEGMQEAVERIYSMNPTDYKEMRKKCREHIENKFTIEKMVEGYEAVYKKILTP